MQDKQWELLSKIHPTDLDSLINELLRIRDITKKTDKEMFLDPPKISSISLKDVGLDEKEFSKAYKRLTKARKNKEKVIVYGDYDVDGVCSTAIMWETLYKNDFDALPFIPNRFRDGYGISTDSIKSLHEQHDNLGVIVTVDNGIVAHEALKTAKKLGIDVIVTDHHQPDDKKLDAFCVLQTDKLAGAGVSLIVSRELGTKFGKTIDDHVELAAIGTVADQVPLTEYNRAIVKQGLALVSKTSRSGLKALLERSQVQGEVGTYDVGYRIGPRINAAGRLDDAMDALRLLCSSNNKSVEILADILEKHNTRRRSIVDDVLQKSTQNIGKKQSIVVVAGEDLHEGVIGLAASNLVETLYRPAIVLSIHGDVAKASARSIQGFSIIDAIREVDDLILQGGGHEMAAGFSINVSNLEEFIQKINENNKSKIDSLLTTPTTKVDIQIDFELINWEMIEKIKELEPFGIGNPRPRFMTSDVVLSNIKTVGSEGGHLKCKVTSNGYSFDAIAFSKGYLFENFEEKQNVSILYSVDVNEWRGHTSIQLLIKDIQ